MNRIPFSSPHFLLTVVVLLVTLGAAVSSDHRAPVVLVKPIDSIPLQLDGWTSAGNEKLRDRIEASLNATSYLSRTYKKERQDLDMFMAFYAQQRAGESMHSPKYCLPGGGWEFTSNRTVTLPLPNGRSAKINRSEVRKGDQKQVLLYWYQSQPRVIASEYESKLFLVWDGLTRGNLGGSIVRVMLPEHPGAEQQALAFATRLIPEIQSCLER